MGWLVAMWGGLLLMYAFGNDSHMSADMRPWGVIAGVLLVLGGMLYEKFGGDD